MKFSRQIKSKSGFSLVEAVIALGIIGVALVMVTSFTISTMKVAKKNELEDVAVQSLVESMEFLKQPGPIYVGKYKNEMSDPQETRSYFSLGSAEEYPESGSTILVPDGQIQSLEVNSCNDTSLHYIQFPDNPEYTVCVQLYVDGYVNGTGEPVRKGEFLIHGVVVWKSIGGIWEKRTVNGYRVGTILANGEQDPARELWKTDANWQ